MTTLRALSLLAALTLTLSACGTRTTPVSSAPTSTITLPGTAVYPEGVAASGDTFYVTSTTDGTIFRGTLGAAAAEVFLPGGADGRTTAIGLKTDGSRLYVAGGSTGKMFVYDVASKALLRAYTTPAVAATFINDVALTADAAYFTDSQRPVLFRVTKSASGVGDAAEPWLDFSSSTVLRYQAGFNLNGIAATADGKYLIVVQSNTGQLFRITVADKTITEIKLNAQVVAGDGILLDGPSADKQTLYVARNNQGIIVPVKLNSDLTAGTVGTSISDPTFRYPTTIAKTNGRLLVVNSQFDKRGPGLTPEIPFTVSNIAAPQ